MIKCNRREESQVLDGGVEASFSLGRTSWLCYFAFFFRLRRKQGEKNGMEREKGAVGLRYNLQ